MSRLLAILLFALCPALAAAQQGPLYIVNGVEMESVAHIPEEDIESITTLAADEQTIAKYGEKANGGVIIISLKFDKEARFTGGESFNEYIASRVKWPDHYPVARVVYRYMIEADGTFRLGEELECTDSRLRRKVLAAIREAPAWEPATKEGKGVESQYVLNIQLPRGKQMPPERYIIML